MNNALRFIRAYNRIDKTLRSVYGYGSGMGYAEVIRRAAKESVTVEAYESKLIDYGRLRNAIVHQGSREEIIAEPHDDVAAEFERLADLLCAPPKFIDCVPTRKVVCTDAEVSLLSCMQNMVQRDISTLPVLKEGKFVGLVTNKLIVESIARAKENKADADEFLKKTRVGSLLLPKYAGVYFEIVRQDIRVDEVLNKFHDNRKLLALVLTENGLTGEPPVSIVTTGDLRDLERLLDGYTTEL